jgi:hypothetical protein
MRGHLRTLSLWLADSSLCLPRWVSFAPDRLVSRQEHFIESKYQVASTVSSSVAVAPGTVTYTFHSPRLPRVVKANVTVSMSALPLISMGVG